MNAKDVDPTGAFERAYAEVAGSPVEATAGPADHAGLVEKYCEGWCKENGGRGEFIDCTGCEIAKAIAALSRATEACECGTDCQDHGAEGGCRYATPAAPQPSLALIEELERANMEINRLKAALTMPDADRRLWFISDCLGKRGHFNRSDICEAFGVSVPQASIDIRRWMEKHPGAISYNKSSKRYEHTIAALASIKRFRTGE